MAQTLTTEPITVSEPHFFWSWQPESNRRPADYKAAALPTELCQHIGGSSGPRTQDLPVMSQALYATKLRIHMK